MMTAINFKKTISFSFLILISTIFFIGGSQVMAQPPVRPPGLDIAMEVQEAHTPSLMEDPGVVGTAVGLNAEGEPVIQVFVESGDVRGIPRNLEGFDVVVKVTGRIVPFKGSAEIMAAELGRHIDADVNTMTLAVQHVKAGTVRLLLTFGDERLPEYPDTPTIVELGISNTGLESWRAIAVPKGVPAPAKTKLEAAFKKAYDDPEFQQFAKKSNLDLYYRTPDQFIKFLKKQYPIVHDTLKGMGFAK